MDHSMHKGMPSRMKGKMREHDMDDLMGRKKFGAHDMAEGAAEGRKRRKKRMEDMTMRRGGR